MSFEPRIWLELRSSRDVSVSQLPCGPNEKRQNFTLKQDQPRSLQVPIEALRYHQHLTSFADSNGGQVEFILRYEGKENETKNVNRYCPVSGKLLDTRSPVCNYRGCLVGFSTMRMKDDFERKDASYIPACLYLDAVIKEHLGELPGGPSVQLPAPQSPQFSQPPRTPEILVQGAEFIKHAIGRGAPAARRIQLQDHAVCWKKPSAAQASATQRLPLESITAVKSGKQTPTFSKKSALDAPTDCCFSIVSAARTLDLQAPNPSLRDQWVEAFNGLLQARQHKNLAIATATINNNITTIHVPSTTNQATPSISQQAPSTPPVVISLPKAEATNVIVAGLGLRLPHETFVNPGLIVFRSEGKVNEKVESLECIHRSTLTMGTRCPEFGVQLVNPPPRFLRICVYHAPSSLVWGHPLPEVLHSPSVALIGSVIVDVPQMVRNSGARLPFLGQELDSKKGIGGLMGCGLMLTVDENKEDMNLQEAIDMLVAGEPVTAYTALEDSEQFTEGTGLRNSLPVESLQLRLVPQGALPEGTSRIAPDTLIGALVLERVNSHGSGDSKVLSLESISDMYEGPQTAVFAAHFDKELLPRSVRACSFSIVSVFQKTTWNLEARNGRVRDGIIQAVYTLMTDGWPGLSSPLGAVVTTDMPPQVNENLAREDSESIVHEVRDWTMAADVSKNGAMPSFGDGLGDYDTEMSTTSASMALPLMHFDHDSRTARYEFSSEAKSQSQVSSGLFEKFEVRGIPHNPRFSMSHTGGISIIRGVSLNSRQRVSMSRPRSNSSRASMMSTASLISVVSQVQGGQTRQSTLQEYLESTRKNPREVGGSVNSMSRDRWSKRAAREVKPVEEKAVHAEMDSDPAIQSLFYELGSIKKSSNVDTASSSDGRKLEAARNGGGLATGNTKPNTAPRQAGDVVANGIPRGQSLSVGALTRSISGGNGNGSSSSSNSVNSGNSGLVHNNNSSSGSSTRPVTNRVSSASVRSQPRTPSQGPNEFANLMSLQNDIQDLKRMIQSRVPAQ